VKVTRTGSSGRVHTKYYEEPRESQWKRGPRYNRIRRREILTLRLHHSGEKLMGDEKSDGGTCVLFTRARQKGGGGSTATAWKATFGAVVEGLHTANLRCLDEKPITHHASLNTTHRAQTNMYVEYSIITPPPTQASCPTRLSYLHWHPRRTWGIVNIPRGSFRQSNVLYQPLTRSMSCHLGRM